MDLLTIWRISQMGNPLLGGSMKDLFLGGLPLEKKMVDHYM
jgi:hypothetical protein